MEAYVRFEIVDECRIVKSKCVRTIFLPVDEVKLFADDGSRS